MSNVTECAVRWNDTVFNCSAEARWAVFLDGMRARWEYRQRKAELSAGTFVPSFWLADWKIWLEVRPVEPDPQARALARELCGATGYAVLLPAALPRTDWQGTVFYQGAAKGPWTFAMQGAGEGRGRELRFQNGGGKPACRDTFQAPPVCVMEDEFCFSFNPEGDGAPWLFVKRWKDVFLFRPPESGEAPLFEDGAGKRRFCLYGRRSPFVFPDGDAACMELALAPAYLEARVGEAAWRAEAERFLPEEARSACPAPRFANAAELYRFMTGFEPAERQFPGAIGGIVGQERGSCAQCGGKGTLILHSRWREADGSPWHVFGSKPEWECTACRSRGGLLEYCMKQQGLSFEASMQLLAGSWPADTSALLGYARGAFPRLLESEDGDVLLLEPPEGYSQDFQCRGCGCGHFIYKMRKGRCRAYCLVCGKYYGHVPMLKNAWKRKGGSRLPKGAGASGWASDAGLPALRRADREPVPAGAPVHPWASRPAGQEAAGTRTEAYPIPFARTAPAAWPAPWRSMLARVKRGWLCWTYWELGQDLGGRADPQRRRVLEQMIAALRRPAGTHTFWPCALAAGPGQRQGRPAASRDLFWSGVRELGVRMVVSMGFRASAAIGLPEEARPLHWEIRNGVVLCTVWDFIRIAEQPSRLDDVVAFLNAAIRQMGF